MRDPTPSREGFVDVIFVGIVLMTPKATGYLHRHSLDGDRLVSFKNSLLQSASSVMEIFWDGYQQEQQLEGYIS